MPYDEALAHFEIGRHAGGDERRDHLDRAADIFKRLGAEYDLQRARAALDRRMNSAVNSREPAEAG
jgi:hypothetical protein